MKRGTRFTFNLTTLGSLVLFVAAIVINDLSWGNELVREYQWKGARCRFTLTLGELRFDNEPERATRKLKIEQERKPIEKTLDRERYGSDAYRHALQEERAFDAAAERRLAAVPSVRHVVPIALVVACAAVLPSIYCGRWIYQRRRPFLEQFRGRFAAAVVLSFLLCGLTIVLWVRSNLVIRDWVVYTDRSPDEMKSTFVALRSLDGNIDVDWFNLRWNSRIQFEMESPNREADSTPPEIPYGLTYQAKRFPRRQLTIPFRERHGFSFNMQSYPSPAIMGYPKQISSGRIGVPYWFLLGLWISFPLLWLRLRLARARRVRLGLCQACGYDLRATPERCPECGAVRGIKAEQ